MDPQGRLTVPAEAAGARLDAWLAGALGMSRSVAAAVVEEGRVAVDGSHRPKSTRLAGGEAVTVAPPGPEPPRPQVPEPVVAFENDDLLVVDKPPGLVVHPAPGHRGTTLVELLAVRAAGRWTPLAVHRLDRDTSGLMIVAKHEQARRELQGLIRRRAVEREYLALVCGRVPSRAGTIEAPLGRDARDRTRMAVRPVGGREARTHFEVEEHLEGFTLVRARLETGRTHQIRAHFAAIGHPVCGDRAYGGADRRVGHGKRRGSAPLGLGRQFLHSARLAFSYSGAAERIELRSGLPADLAEALRRARATGR